MMDYEKPWHRYFATRSQLLEILKLIPLKDMENYVSDKPQINYNSWGYVKLICNGETRTFRDALLLAIFLDRNLTEYMGGFVYFHSPLNSYFGLDLNADLQKTGSYYHAEKAKKEQEQKAKTA